LFGITFKKQRWPNWCIQGQTYNLERQRSRIGGTNIPSIGTGWNKKSSILNCSTYHIKFMDNHEVIISFCSNATPSIKKKKLPQKLKNSKSEQIWRNVAQQLMLCVDHPQSASTVSFVMPSLLKDMYSSIKFHPPPNPHHKFHDRTRYVQHSFIHWRENKKASKKERK